jgi:uncharacterized protein (TIGR03435 family)
MTWESQALALLSASLVRPFVLTAAAWLILRVLRVRHPASRHAVWTAVLIGMMVLPLVSVFAPQWKLPLLPKKPETVTQIQVQESDKFSDAGAHEVRAHSVAAAQSQDLRSSWPAPGTIVLWCYLAGMLAMVAWRVIGWMMLVRVIARSKALRLRRLRESADVLTPVTVGVLRPSVILPAGWLNWNTDTKRAVLAHEFAHIRRGDRWIALLTRIAKCVYWFHPLAWWVSRQIADEAELSCDAVVLEKNGDPGGYSRILLGFAETVNAAGYRAALPGLAMASRSGMSHRIDQVFELAGGNLRRLSRPGIVLALMGLPVIFIAATGGVTAQSASRPKFDVVSVRRCSPNGLPGPGSGEGGGRGTGPQYSPGRIGMQCMTVGAMMNAAYLGLLGEGDGLLNYMPSIGDDNWLRKAPGWVNTDLYSVEGKTDDPAAKVANGRGRSSGDRVLERMLQSALEDRFHLKLHQETEEVPMYNLTVAKGGLRRKPMEPDGCSAPDTSQGTPPPRGIFMTGEWSPAGKMPCMIVLHTAGPDWALDAGGQTPGNLIGMLSKALDRHVFDKTGITELYTFHLRFAHDGSTPGNLPPAVMERMFLHTDVPSGPSIFTALESAGLKLEPTKGPQGHYVIDHIERPSEN